MMILIKIKKLIFSHIDNPIIVNSILKISFKLPFASTYYLILGYKKGDVMDDEIMTLGQVAAYFKISEQIIINLLKEGEIPAFRIEDHWRIRKSDINDFIEFLIKNDLPLTSEVKPQKENISGEEYHKIWTSTGKKTIKEWVQLLDKNKQIYDKYKCLDIDYLTYKKIYIKTLLSESIPKESDTKDEEMAVKLDKNLQEILSNYSKTNNISERESIEIGIRALEHR